MPLMRVRSTPATRFSSPPRSKLGWIFEAFFRMRFPAVPAAGAAPGSAGSTSAAGNSFISAAKSRSQAAICACA